MTRWLPPALFITALIILSMLYGFFANRYQLFPAILINQAVHGFHQLINPDHYWTYTETDQTEKITLIEAEKMAPGLNKIVNVEGDRSLAVRVLDADANELHRWRVEWNDVFPEKPDFLTESEIPKERPGTHIHGAEILDNGDLVFNFEHLALVKMDACGKVKWTLPYRTHHSIFVDDDNNFWVSAQRNYDEPIPEYPYIKPQIIEPVILKVSPQGEILLEKSVFELLAENNQLGALYASSTVNENPYVTSDMLHMNDVEVFSKDMEANIYQRGFFKAGDVMISLRNTNSVFIFDRNWTLKHKVTFDVVRQHDPDFIDANRISILDNYNIPLDSDNESSRIVIHDAQTGTSTVAFQGNQNAPWYTDIMGKHQWLENGNLLLNERFGRVIEVDQTGKNVWEFNNIVAPGQLGLTEEAERLPLSMDKAFFETVSRECSSSNQD